MFLRVSKYPPNAIFRNDKRATRKRNQLNDLAYKSAAAYVEHAFAPPVQCLHPTSTCIYKYKNYISGRTSCRKCSKCFYVFLNIRPIQYSEKQIIIIKAQRANVISTMIWHTNPRPPMPSHARSLHPIY